MLTSFLKKGLNFATVAVRQVKIVLENKELFLKKYGYFNLFKGKYYN